MSAFILRSTPSLLSVSVVVDVCVAAEFRSSARTLSDLRGCKCGWGHSQLSALAVSDQKLLLQVMQRKHGVHL